MRIDLIRDTAPIGSRFQSRMYDGRRRALTFITGDTKSYMQLHLRARAIAGPVPDTTGGQEPDTSRFVATGTDEVIAGIVCDDYVARMRAAIVEECVAKEMHSFVPLRVLAGMGVLPADVTELSSRQTSDSRWALPLKVVTHGDGRTWAIVATHVSRGAPGSATFDIPSDYKATPPFIGQ